MVPEHGLTDAVLQSRIRSYNKRYPGRITVDELRAIIASSHRRCCWCGKEDLHGPDLTIEHLEPRNDPKVLAVACFSCNSSHNAGFKTKRDVPEEIRRLRAEMRNKTWEKDNRDLYKAYRQLEYLRHKNGYIKKYREENRERLLAGKQRYREEKKAKIALYQKEWDAANKTQHAEQRRRWREANPETAKQRWRESYGIPENAAKIKARARERMAEKLKDPEYRVRLNAAKRESYHRNKGKKKSAE